MREVSRQGSAAKVVRCECKWSAAVVVARGLWACAAVSWGMAICLAVQLLGRRGSGDRVARAGRAPCGDWRSVGCTANWETGVSI